MTLGMINFLELKDDPSHISFTETILTQDETTLTALLIAAV